MHTHADGSTAKPLAAAAVNALERESNAALAALLGRLCAREPPAAHVLAPAVGAAARALALFEDEGWAGQHACWQIEIEKASRGLKALRATLDSLMGPPPPSASAADTASAAAAARTTNTYRSFLFYLKEHRQRLAAACAGAAGSSAASTTGGAVTLAGKPTPREVRRRRPPPASAVPGPLATARPSAPRPTSRAFA